MLNDGGKNMVDARSLYRHRLPNWRIKSAIYEPSSQQGALYAWRIIDGPFGRHEINAIGRVLKSGRIKWLPTLGDRQSCRSKMQKERERLKHLALSNPQIEMPF